MWDVEKRILIAVLILAGFAQTYSTQGTGGESKLRVLHFPKKQSLGKLYMQDANIKLPISLFETFGDNADWEYLEQAKGTVIVPAGKRLRLLVTQSGLRGLSWLSQLKANDLYEIYFSWTKADEIQADDSCMPHLAGLTGLKVLGLRTTRITAKGLSYLKNLKSLEQLDLPVRTTDEGLEQIAGLTSLKVLHCQKANISNVGFAHLGKLSSLVKLEVDPDRNCDGGIVHLANLPSLRSLIIHDFLGAAGLEQVSRLRGLEYLDVTSSQVTDENLGFISRLSRLRCLNIKDTQVTEAGLVHLQGLTSLEYLEGISVGKEGLLHLVKLDNLKNIYFGGTKSGLRHLTALRSLQELDIERRATITDAEMSYISTLTNLKRLSFWAAITDRGLSKLTLLKSLNHLRIDSEGDSTKLSISGLSCLNEMPNLTHLNLDNVAQDDSGLDISKLTKLEKLTIRTKDPIRDKDLACLSNLKNLKSLQGIGGFGDTGMVHLSGLINMERLYIGRTNATDKGLSYLSNMKSLIHLEINGDFTDEGLKHLEGFKSLRRLAINSTNALSPVALEHLAQQLPELSIFRVNGNKVPVRAFVRGDPRSTLVGQPVPNFGNIRINFNTDQAKDQKLLVCFWDMNQRPSRNCVRQIKNKAQALSGKGVYVVLVHAEPVEEDKLKQWLGKNTVALPVCRVTGKVKQLKLQWNIQSLPWLILTDKKHVVRAEGFGIDELNEKIKESENAGP